MTLEKHNRNQRKLDRMILPRVQKRAAVAKPGQSPKKATTGKGLFEETGKLICPICINARPMTTKTCLMT